MGFSRTTDRHTYRHEIHREITLLIMTIAALSDISR